MKSYIQNIAGLVYQTRGNKMRH